MALLHTLLLLSSATLIDGWVLKVGGPIQSTSYGANAKKAYELFQSWASTSTLGFTVELHFSDYSSDTAAQVATDLTDPSICQGNGNCVDVLVCPYGSGGSKITIDGVKNPETPIMVWGGAADSIFTENCAGKKCFGTLTQASDYFDAALMGLGSIADSVHNANGTTVALITNDNAFSLSLAAGITQYLNYQEDKLSLGMTKTVPRGALDAAGIALVKEVIASKPEIIAVTGHSGGDVEDIIMTIASDTLYRPKAIVATNSITGAAKARFEAKNMVGAMEGIIMPQQWARTPGLKDDIVGWTSTDFTAAIGADKATYHSASAAAGAVAIANAISQNALASSAGLATGLAALDINTFYGHISFTANGNLAMKPMYAEQHMKMDSSVVMPLSAANGYLRFPLSAHGMWAAHSYKCGKVKEFYKKHMCCGNPDKTVMIGDGKR